MVPHALVELTRVFGTARRLMIRTLRMRSLLRAMTLAQISRECSYMRMALTVQASRTGAIIKTATRSRVRPCRPANFRQQPAWHMTLRGPLASCWISLLLA
jgi:hypothetical protein